MFSSPKISLKLFVYFLFSVLFFFSIRAHATPASSYKKINIFSYKNGKGLETSGYILKKALSEMGHTVYEKEMHEKRKEHDLPVDINIFFEQINTEWVESASVNWFIPNPDYYIQGRPILKHIDLILCRTREVERIFKDLNKRTYYLGFSSMDCKVDSIKKNFSSYLHVAGGSPFKGTKAIAHAWESALTMPPLTIVIHYALPPTTTSQLTWIRQKIPIQTLRSLQNTCGIHLCLSETEGFGHYLMEAMSTGAVVLTTDAPPMNEFITDKRCLVPYNKTAKYNLSTRYVVDAEMVTSAIQNLMTLSLHELKEIGDYNRSRYLEKTQEFRENLERLIREEFSHTTIKSVSPKKDILQSKLF